jgi:3-oxoacyl-[acyl-carrier-protein] synthase I
MLPLRLAAYTATTAAGPGNAALWQALQQGRSGLRVNDLPHCQLSTWIGRVDGVEAVQLPVAHRDWDCRNNRLAWLGLNQDGFLEQARALVLRHGASRVALVLGTSTSSMASTEEAYRAYSEQGTFPAECLRPAVHSPHSLTGFVAAVLGITGPQLTVATACSSSARVFGSAERLMRAGLADAAIVGGVDSLCLSVMYGFHALELMSAHPCRPFDQARDGLNIGEAAGFALLERADRAPRGPLLSGYGESSDAHHMSSPHPEGLGARHAMQAALQRAGLAPSHVDYINLHGTSTRMNDTVEAQAVTAEFTQPVACSSTKGYTGHTLGAAGIVEAVITLLALEHQQVPGSCHCTQPEPLMQDYLRLHTTPAPLRHALSNSFGFGGNNCSLLFTRVS